MPRMGSLYIFTIAHHSLPGVVIKTDGVPIFGEAEACRAWYRLHTAVAEGSEGIKDRGLKGIKGS